MLSSCQISWSYCSIKVYQTCLLLMYNHFCQIVHPFFLLHFSIDSFFNWCHPLHIVVTIYLVTAIMDFQIAIIFQWIILEYRKWGICNKLDRRYSNSPSLRNKYRSYLQSFFPLFTAHQQHFPFFCSEKIWTFLPISILVYAFSSA